MVTKAELEAELDEVRMAAKARFLSGFLPKLVGHLKGRDAHVIFVNQTRLKPGVVYGNPEYSPGGQSLKFFASTRIRLGRGKAADGVMEVKVKSVKSRFSEPGREISVRLNFAEGWDDRWTTLSLAKDLKLVEDGSKDYDEAREALGWPMSEAAERLGADPETAKLAVGERKKAKRTGKKEA
jgi:recombination protein RecA